MSTIYQEDIPPLEMAEILEEFKAKLEGENDLHPSEYLEKDVLALYSIAHKHYMVDNYSEAEELFIRLCLARPLEIAYWKGLASARQMNRNYGGALVCHGMCALLDDKELSYHIYGAECLYYLEETEEAKKAITYVTETITEEHPNWNLFNRVKQMLGV